MVYMASFYWLFGKTSATNAIASCTFQARKIVSFPRLRWSVREVASLVDESCGKCPRVCAFIELIFIAHLAGVFHSFGSLHVRMIIGSEKL